ncbi:hypothetical protein [Arthrobacter bambusae]|uniref:Uncharacterized protein n=1 Tax=Arthrobacter bambusae TaxID=1338426 RepID=A0AAW8DJ30_9MICC|nr:hypothetical protein [Arthrobacter bambusae]MDP9905620.1 hypothetical protein [Arthrobacter bambusae]MDQ0127298.1 hypothetical protein [Arthrobacter bambusae]MDQ0178640.1 hypothetical protein [Arthrobacter bambusae]
MDDGAPQVAAGVLGLGRELVVVGPENRVQPWASIWVRIDSEVPASSAAWSAAWEALNDVASLHCLS